ncbi:TPA: restriction endonuclease subunit S [Candidatus Woesearchaeota archaeon]|nr:restriction endonuclease subunit S [Candidatus Woesearchaeota archaeon]
MKQELELKQTELGELPVDWKVEKFEDCIIKKRIKVGKVQQQKYKDVGKFPIVDQGKNKIAGYWDDKENVYSGDLPIVIFGDHTRIVKFIDFPFVCGADGTKVIVPDKSKVDPLYFYYAVSSLDVSSRGYNRHYSLLKEKFIARPPLPEQQKIAYVLSAIQEDKEKTENIISSYKELKKSLMKHLFKYGHVKFEDAEKVKLKETEIGEMPENWEVNEIKELIEKTKQKDMRKENTEFKYIDVSSIDRDFYRIVGFTLHKGKTSPSRARKIVKTNDIIVATVRPTLKRIALVPEDYDNQICSTAFCVLKANAEQLNSKFLYYSTQRSLFFDALESIQRGASYPAVTDSDIKKQKIAYPPPACQQEIAEILSSVDSKIEQEENKKKALEELFKSMLSNLMTAKIRVNYIEVKNE